MKAKKRIRDVVYHVIVFGIGILMIYPLIWMFMSSFKETKTIFQTAGSLIPNPFTLDNYINGLKGFAKVPFLVFFKNSLFISVVATIGTVISSAVVAYGFARFDFKGKKILPLSFPSEFKSQLLYYLFLRFRHLIPITGIPCNTGLIHHGQYCPNISMAPTLLISRLHRIALSIGQGWLLSS